MKNLRAANGNSRKVKRVLGTLAVAFIGIGFMHALRNVGFKNLLVEEDPYTKSRGNDFRREEQTQVEEAHKKK